LDNVLTVVDRPGAKSDLAGLSLNQQASQKELEGVQKMAHRQKSPRGSIGRCEKHINIAGFYAKKS
jgi:hypothetical protein